MRLSRCSAMRSARDRRRLDPSDASTHETNDHSCCFVRPRLLRRRHQMPANLRTTFSKAAGLAAMLSGPIASNDNSPASSAPLWQSTQYRSTSCHCSCRLRPQRAIRAQPIAADQRRRRPLARPEVAIVSNGLASLRMHRPLCCLTGPCPRIDAFRLTHPASDRPKDFGTTRSTNSSGLAHLLVELLRRVRCDGLVGSATRVQQLASVPTRRCTSRAAALSSARLNTGPRVGTIRVSDSRASRGARARRRARRSTRPSTSPAAANLRRSAAPPTASTLAAGRTRSMSPSVCGASGMCP